MNSKFKITIPKPCRENWNIMTPKEKGRFCGSCSKTVVDFTKKSTEEIQDYLTENRNQKTCGHFYKKQLDSITIEIPNETFNRQLSFQKMFALSLLFVMGTTLFSCQYSDGKKQSIKSVIIKDSIKIIEEDVELIFPKEGNIDSLKPKNDSIITMGKIKIPANTITTTGITICEIEQKNDSIIDNTTIGDVEEVEGMVIMGDMIIEEPSEPYSFYQIDRPAKFKTTKKSTKESLIAEFGEKTNIFFEKNFNYNSTKNLDLKEGKYKIFMRFEIDTLGNVFNIQIRAPHNDIKKEVLKVFEKLPPLVPAKNKGKKVKSYYTLPIAFRVE